MKFDEFLNLVKVMRMLYGVETARVFFELNIGSYYNLSIKDLTKKIIKLSVDLSN